MSQYENERAKQPSKRFRLNSVLNIKQEKYCKIFTGSHKSNAYVYAENITTTGILTKYNEKNKQSLIYIVCFTLHFVHIFLK